MSNTNIDNKDLEKLGEFVRENKGRGNIAGLTACDEFGIPLDGNHCPGAFYPVSCEDAHDVVAAIQSGDVDCSFNVDLSFTNHWNAATEKAFPTEQLEEFKINSEIKFKHIDLPIATIAGDNANYATDAYHPTIGGMQAFVGGIDSNLFPIIEMENPGLKAAVFVPSEEMINSEIEIPELVSDRGIVIPTATYSLGKLGDDELKENILSMNKAITKGLEPKEEKINLRDHAHAFMLQKDKHKLNFKTYLNSAFRKNEKAIKDKFIKDLYNTKILYKDYKHLNFAAKRLILNNRLRANVIKYCSGMEIAATDILVLLENDSSIQDYLFKNLPVAIRKMIDRGIEL